MKLPTVCASGHGTSPRRGKNSVCDSALRLPVVTSAAQHTADVQGAYAPRSPVNSAAQHTAVVQAAHSPWLAYLVTIVSLCLASNSASGAENYALSSALESISADELQRHVAVLADDSFEGREAGSRGGHAAGGYIARYFEKFGLKPAGDRGSYFQSFGAGYRNILGLVEGRDPRLKHEVVLISAHYDHVGYGNQSNSYGPTGYIHNGADDNASGTAAMIELIEAFQQLPEPPRRSVLIALWDGEEQGLLGSQHFVSQPTIPLKDIVLMVNVDMIGRMRGQRLDVYGSRSSFGLRQLVSRENTLNLDLDFTWELKNNSDHWNFYDRNIPILMLHTGLHDDYHRPSDDVERINSQGIQQVTQLLMRVTAALAEQPQRPRFRSASRGETPAHRDALEQSIAPLPPRLGVNWQAEDSQAGLRITSVSSGSAAEQAGLRNGDRLMELNGHPIEDEDKFRSDILAAEPTVELTVKRSDRQETERVKVTLAGQPVRVGLSWRDDRGEPQTAIVTRVVPGSPAHEAGLQLRDRIYEVGGQSFKDSAELAERLKKIEEPTELLVERRGRLIRLMVDKVDG